MPRTDEVEVVSANAAKALGDMIAGQKLVSAQLISLTAGTTQTQAGAVFGGNSGQIVVSTCANANDGVRLPVATRAGRMIILTNDGAQNLKVWPSTSGTINGGSANAADATVLATTKSRIYISTSALNWELLVLE